MNIVIVAVENFYHVILEMVHQLQRMKHLYIISRPQYNIVPKLFNSADVHGKFELCGVALSIPHEKFVGVTSRTTLAVDKVQCPVSTEQVL